MVIDWILGALFRPGDTFDKARNQLRFGYLWILLCAYTIDVVVTYHSPVQMGDPAPWDFVAMYVLLWYLILFDLQTLLLWGAARLFRWALPWREAAKFVGLSFSVLVVENIVLFYPMLKDMRVLFFWGDIIFVVWLFAIMMTGLKRITGLGLWHSLALTTVAVLPLQLAMIALNWYSAFVSA